VEERSAPHKDLESKRPPARTYRYQLMSTKDWQNPKIDAIDDYEEQSCRQKKRKAHYLPIADKIDIVF
jgi:hypothetical protein